MSPRFATTFDATTAQDQADVVELAMTEEEFRGFYDRTARGVAAYLIRLTGDRKVVDDVLQETYYRFLRAGVTLDNDTHRRRYLYRVATSVARDRFRRTLTRPIEAPVDNLDDSTTSRADGHEAVEHRLDLSRAFGRLRPRDRAMLWLAYALGASHREIADVVGVGHTSVKPLLYRARQRLAKLVGRNGDAP